jgi:hypothetical protein
MGHGLVDDWESRSFAGAASFDRHAEPERLLFLFISWGFLPFPKFLANPWPPECFLGAFFFLRPLILPVCRFPRSQTDNLYCGAMRALDVLMSALSTSERQRFARMSTPAKIQDFLDRLSYSCDDYYRCPLRVLREGKGHCFDGAVFAAAALALIGAPPILIDLLPNGRDDDHVIAPFRRHGHWGALAKSNFVGLRYREPVYRSPRELVMSYFEQYYNLAREKTLKGYTRPLRLSRFGSKPWTVEDGPLEQIADALDEQPSCPILTSEMARALSPVDERSFRSGLWGAQQAGLYQPRSRQKKSSNNRART